MKREERSECPACGFNGGLMLHTVLLRGSYRLLCSNCVLETHPGLYCSICLDVFENSPPPPHMRLVCIKCPSICHLSCATASSPSSSASSPSSSSSSVTFSFVCPPCSNPNFTFFKFSNKKSKVDGGILIDDNTACDKKKNHANNLNHEKAIDVDSARALVAAAKIAASSMSKAAAIARAEADRRVKEAVLAKQRAMMALEKLMSFPTEEKERPFGDENCVLADQNVRIPRAQKRTIENATTRREKVDDNSQDSDLETDD